MKGYIDGELVEFTEEQEEKLRENVIQPTATIETRVVAIETAIVSLVLKTTSSLPKESISRPIG